MKPDLKRLVAALETKKTAQEAVKAEYKAKEKGKPLTTAERLDRIEKLLGLNK